MSGTLTAVPPGWYDDPADPTGTYRWWDGAEWTTYTSPKQQLPVTYSRDPSLRGTAFSYGEAAVPSLSGSPQTPGVWLLAVLPLINVAVYGLAVWVAVTANVPIPPLATYAIAVGLSWWFGWLDARELRRRGYPAASLLWMLLLPPLVYLIARGRILRKIGAKAWPPEVGYVGSIALGIFVIWVVALGIAGSMPAQAGVQYYAGTFGDDGVVTAPAVEDMITAQMSTDQAASVDCSSAVVARDAYFDCGGADASGAPTVYAVHVCGCGDVYFSFSPGVFAAEPAEENDEHAFVPQYNSAGSIPEPAEPWLPQIEDTVVTAAGLDSIDCSSWDESEIVSSMSFGCMMQDDVGPGQVGISIDADAAVSYTVYEADGTRR